MRYDWFMATDDTIPRVARPRGELTQQQRRGLILAENKRDDAIHEYRRYLVDLLDAGCSYSEVSRESGVSTSTLQHWKKVTPR